MAETPTPPPPPFVAHIKARLNFLGPAAAQASIVLYYEILESAPNASQMNVIADSIKAHFKSELKAVIADDHQFLGVACVYDDNTNQYEGFSTDAADAGTAVQPTHPEEVAVVIQRRAGLKGRPNRGRVFLPFVPIDATGGNSSLLPAWITKYKAVATKMESNITSSGLILRARTPNFKQGILNPVTECRVVGEVMSRRDRRSPKRPVVYN